MQTKKISTTFFIVFFTLSLFSQNKIQNAFDATGPAIENIRIDVIDDEGNESYLPVCIIKGKEQGPVFTMVSGVHGFEYPPIIATQQLMQEIKPENLAGTLLIVPIANTSSFFSRTPFVNPQDQVNLNRTFPGNANGSVTEKIAHIITSEIVPLSDVLLDIHGGDASEDLMPFICYYNNEDRPNETRKARDLSEASGFQHIVTYTYTLADDAPAKYVFKQAVQDGKTGLSIESGKLGNVQKEAVTLIKNAVYNMLNEMKMYDHKIETDSEPIRLNRQVYMKSDKKGIFYSEFKAGDSVEKGETIGHITDEFGTVLSKFKAPNSGMILYKIGTPPVGVDETLFCIAYSS